jgi:ribosomal protein S12 methylthiotransferase accessory factor
VNRRQLAEVERTPLERSLPRLKSLTSPLTGVVPFTQQLLPTTDDARLFHVASITCESEAILGSSSNRFNGGISVTYDAALAAAIGEGLERYAGAYTEENLVRFTTAAEIGPAAARPETFTLFHPSQYARQGFPFVPFTSETRIRWTPAFRLPGGEPAYVPTQLSAVGDVYHGEPRLGYATSSGMACGPTLEEAILSGLLELVERDAFLVAWYNALSLPLVDWRSDAVIAEENRRFFAPTGLEFRVVDLSPVIGVPTALSVCRDEYGEVALAVGCASAPTMRDAVRKSIRESFQTRSFGRQLRADMPDWRCEDFDAIETFEDHVLFYAGREGAARAGFIDRSPVRTPIAAVAGLEGRTVTDWIRAIVAKLARVGASVFVVETTPPDLRSAGLHAVAVVSPELCRLDVPYRQRYLGGRRLYDAAFEAGLLPRPLTIDGLNPLPHPFP